SPSTGAQAPLREDGRGTLVVHSRGPSRRQQALERIHGRQKQSKLRPLTAPPRSAPPSGYRDVASSVTGSSPLADRREQEGSEHKSSQGYYDASWPPLLRHTLSPLSSD